MVTMVAMLYCHYPHRIPKIPMKESVADRPLTACVLTFKILNQCNKGSIAIFVCPSYEESVKDEPFVTVIRRVPHNADYNLHYIRAILQRTLLVFSLVDFDVSSALVACHSVQRTEFVISY